MRIRVDLVDARAKTLPDDSEAAVRELLTQRPADNRARSERSRAADVNRRRVRPRVRKCPYVDPVHS
jgi:hypothetical protein